MSYQAELIGQVFFIRWDAVPTPQQVAEVEARLASAAARLGPVRPTFVCSVKATAKVPDAKERELIQELTRIVNQYCSCCHMLLEGSDLQHIAQRLIISAAMLIMRVQARNFLRVHRSGYALALALRTELKADAPEILRRARERELLE